MPKPRSLSGEKNLISQHLIDLRKEHNLSRKLQLAGYDMDKNIITRIETNRRYVTDIEIRALAHIFDVTCDYLIEGKADYLKGLALTIKIRYQFCFDSGFHFNILWEWFW